MGELLDPVRYSLRQSAQEVDGHAVLYIPITIDTDGHVTPDVLTAIAALGAALSW